MILCRTAFSTRFKIFALLLSAFVFLIDQTNGQRIKTSRSEKNSETQKQKHLTQTPPPPKKEEKHFREQITKPLAEEVPDIELWVNNQHPAASDLNVGSQDAPYRTVLAAIRNTAREIGDGTALINILPGTYRETIVIPEHTGTIIIRGVDARRVIITGAELLNEWEAAEDICEGCYLHENLLPDGQSPSVFFADKQVQNLYIDNKIPTPGRFTIYQGKILWQPHKNLDWRRADISLPTRPYPEETGGALISINNARLRISNVTIMHTATAAYAISINGNSYLQMHNVFLKDNLSPAISADGTKASNGQHILLENCHITNNLGGALVLQSTSCIVRNSVLRSNLTTPKSPIEHTNTALDDRSVEIRSPLISSENFSTLQITDSLIELDEDNILAEISSGQSSLLRNNTILFRTERAEIHLQAPGPVGIHANNILCTRPDSLMLITFNNTPVAEKAYTPKTQRQGHSKNQNFPLSISANSFQSSLLFTLIDPPLIFPPDPVQYEGDPAVNWSFTGNCLAAGRNVRLTRTNRSIFFTDGSIYLGKFIEQLATTPHCPGQPLEQLRERTVEKLRLLKD